MINESTKVNIIDNSGAIEAKCIKILLPKSFYGRRVGKVGDIIVVTITKTITGSKIKKGDIMKGLIVRTKKESNKLNTITKKNSNIVYGKKSLNNGYNLKFEDNGIVLIKTGIKNIWDLSPIGSRIKGPICDSIKINKNCSKIVSISE